MIKRPRPAFVLTSSLVFAACDKPHTVNPPYVEPSGAPAAAMSLPPKDAEGHTIFNRAGTCYVQVDKKGPPPKDLMSGERWVEDKTIPCPKELEDPVFKALPDGFILSQDQKTGECFQQQGYGNPPPPPTPTECPAFAKKPK